MYIELAIFALFIFCYSLVAGRLERAAASGPIVFVVAGLLMGPLGLGWFDGDVSRTGLRLLADLTLALILFIDAANADLAILKRQFRIPSRMLLFGLPGVIFLGTIVQAALNVQPFTDLRWYCLVGNNRFAKCSVGCSKHCTQYPSFKQGQCIE